MANGFTISSAAVSDRGLSEKRPQNEDSFLEIPAKGIFAVADGVGGAQAGEVASQMAMEILGEAFNNMPEGSDAEETMNLALVQANAAIHQMSTELPQLAQMATTVVALHLDGNIATIGHAGDSRLYRLDQKANLHRETEDHSMVADEVRAGRMTEEQAENHPGKNIINRALGAEGSVQLDLKTKIVGEDCMWLLCSDGVTRHITDDELAGMLAFGEPDEICRRIKDLCYSRGAEDNLTAVVIRYEGEMSPADFQDTLPQIVGEPSDLGEDEPTVASARSFANGETDEDDDLLEIDTQEINLSQSDEGGNDLIDFEQANSSDVDPPEPSGEAETTVPELIEPHIAVDEEDMTLAAVPGELLEPEHAVVRDDRPMFGSATSTYKAEPPPSSGNKTLAAAIGSLVLGALIGGGAYYFLVAPPAPQPNSPLGEMRAQNIPLTAFEENRRSVDKEPALYISRATTPEDAEDHYLLGRAYLLTGDFPKARTAFTEARNRMNEADPANAQVMKDDIALALAVTNDTTIQSVLRKEIEAARGLPAGSMSNTNSNR